jgi:hypothetical protein
MLCQFTSLSLSLPDSNLPESPNENKNTNFTAVYDALLSVDIVASSLLRNITGAKIQAVKDVVGEAAFNQGMMATLGRTF